MVICATPEVTILTTSYNAGAYLKSAIESLLSQTYQAWKLILVDNGSTDDSFKLLSTLDSRISTYRLPQNIGRTRALQFALSLSKSPLTAVLDADDLAHPARLARQVSVFADKPNVVLVGSHVRVMTNDCESSHHLNGVDGIISNDCIGERNIFAHSSVMFRTDAARTAGGYDSRFRYAQDYDLFLKLAKQGDLYVLAESLTTIRRHSNSLTNSRDTQFIRLQDELVLFREASSRLDLSEVGLKLNRRRQALVLVELGFREMVRGNVWSGLKTTYSSLKADSSVSWINYILRGRPRPKF